MRNIDRLTVRRNKITSLELMQNAAEACFQEIRISFSANLAGKTALVLCGPGNNGGDGAAVAQKLSTAGVDTVVVLFGRVENLRGDARTNFETVARLARNPASGALRFVECNSEDEWKDLASGYGSFDLIVDALFGTGLTRPLTGVFAAVVDQIRQIQSRNIAAANQTLVVSIDIPSGLNADLPIPIGPAVQADVTVTFTAPKAANVLPPASHLNGRLVVANIGSPDELLESLKPNVFLTAKEDAIKWLVRTRYTPESYKNSHGHVLVIAGSRGYTGAAVLCGNAAIRSGAGLVTIATAASAQTSIAASVMPEVMTAALAETDRGAISEDALDHVTRLASRATVIAIGPGLSSDDERTRRLVYTLAKNRQTPVVIDADALNCLAPWPEDLQGSSEAPLILTPHAGEMKRLLGINVEFDDRLTVAQNFANKNKVILVLKGSRTLVAEEGRVFVNPTGNAGAGTAGSGDTLTGIIAGFIAQEVASHQPAKVLDATIAALYVGGLAADYAANDLGMRSMVASDIREHFSSAICSLDPEGERPRRNAR